MEMVLALQKAHVGVSEVSTEGKPQLLCKVPQCRKALDSWTVLRGLAHCWDKQCPIFFQHQEKPGPAGFQPWGSTGSDLSAAVVGDVERGCKMGEL